MNRYILRRLALIPVALILVNFLGFTYAHLALPGQLAQNPYLAATGGPSPLGAAYLDYLKGLLHLNFGTMPPAGAPVGPVVAAATVASLGLLALALAASVLLGVSLGLAAVRTPGQRGRTGISEPATIAPWLTALTTGGLAMPGFYIGSLLILGVLAYIIRVPMKVSLPVQGYGWDLHLVLPVLVLAARPTAQIAQMTAALLVAELDKTYVVAARSVGQPWKMIRHRHALRNVISPLAIAVFSALRLMVGELIVVEWLFSWPGLGRLLAVTLISPQATSTPRPMFLHAPTLAAVLMVLAVLFLLADLTSGLLARLADPRLRAATQRIEGAAYD